MSYYKIRISHTPKAKASVRMQKSKWYNPSAKGMARTTNAIKEQLPPDFKILEGPLMMIVHYRLPTRKFASAKRKKFLDGQPHVLRPVGDNLEKFLNDCMTGVVFKDDCQIAFLFRSKTLINSLEGETLIFIRELRSMEVADYGQMVHDIQDHISPSEVPIVFLKPGEPL